MGGGGKGRGRIRRTGLTPDWLGWLWRKSQLRLTSQELSNFSAAPGSRFGCPGPRRRLLWPLLLLLLQLHLLTIPAITVGAGRKEKKQGSTDHWRSRASRALVLETWGAQERASGTSTVEGALSCSVTSPAGRAPFRSSGASGGFKWESKPSLSSAPEAAAAAASRRRSGRRGEPSWAAGRGAASHDGGRGQQRAGPGGQRRGQRRRRRGRAQSPQAPLEARAAPPVPATAAPVPSPAPPSPPAPAAAALAPAPVPPAATAAPPAAAPAAAARGGSRPLRLERGHRPRPAPRLLGHRALPVLPRHGPHLLRRGDRPPARPEEIQDVLALVLPGTQAVSGERPLPYSGKGSPPQLSESPRWSIYPCLPGPWAKFYSGNRGRASRGVSVLA